MEKFKAVLDLQSKHRSALGYGLVTLLTAGGEKIFSTVVFQCPCTATWNLPYGLVFLLVPALALFLLGYALSARTWRLLTGCCSRSASARSSSGLRSAFVCAQLSATAALAPLTWVAVALLGGSFYQCAVTGSARLASYLCKGHEPNCIAKLPQVPCNKQEAEMQEILSQLKAQSQVLGWILIAAVIILLLAVKSVTRCFSPVSYLQLKFWEIYLEKEKQSFKVKQQNMPPSWQKRMSGVSLSARSRRNATPQAVKTGSRSRPCTPSIPRTSSTACCTSTLTERSRTAASAPWKEMPWSLSWAS